MTVELQTQKLIELIERNKNWKSVLQKRQHKFVITFIGSGYSFQEVAIKHRFTVADICSIMGKIEKRLVVLDEERIMNHKRQQRIEKEKEKEKEKGGEFFLNTLDEQSRNMFTYLIKNKDTIDIDEVFPTRLAHYIKTILETKSIEKSVQNLGIRKKHLMERIKGRKSPRSNAEKGAMYYLEKSLGQVS
jgi:predicted DNA-binding protein YlxM (UPF0122 family)